MIFQHTLDAVLDGRKTQTRRIVKPGDIFVPFGEYKNDDGITVTQFPYVYREKPIYNKRYTIYAVGQTYAVQPGRGKASVARIRVLDIRREDVRNISEADALAEGFGSRLDFWHTWVEMHDKPFHRLSRYATEADLREFGFYRRPAARYDAWALTFELVKVAEAVA